MRTHALLLATLAACAPPTLETAQPDVLFEGGDGLSTVEGRVLRGEILEDMTLDADEPWILDGTVFIGADGDDTVLTIEPGTVIFGNPATRGALVITRGSQIIADGTASAPIVFTSPRSRGARRAGDWGGLVINGYAPLNGCPSSPCEGDGEGGSGPYGGDDPEDDSGILRYVRIEYAGALVNLEDELNGISFQGVGRGTTVDYVQAHVTADDGVEFFGGTVDVTHLMITGGGDDSLDWTSGWSGRAQHVIVQQHPNRGDRGIEADNNEDDNDAVPRSSPILANVTIVGQEEGNIGLNFRRGTGVQLYNSVITGFETCLDIDDDATWANGFAGAGVLSGDLVVSGTWLDCPSVGSDSEWQGQTVDDFLALNSGVMASAPVLTDPANPDDPDFTDLGGTLQTGAAPIADPFFEPTDHVGAIGSADWTVGWTTAGTD